MPLELELTLGSPLVWLGLPRGMDHLRPLPAESGPRFDEQGLLFRADEWTLSVALFSRPRTLTDDQFAPAPPHRDVPFEFSSGTGQLRFVSDSDEEALVGRVFLLSDLSERTTIQLPATAADATLTWQWFAQDGVVYRLLIWSPGLGD
ncbi:hypothetical protein ACFQU3_19640 [Terrabacter sp. GCM10028922]|uniref:hypothetical protein n=1 Tax=Terrabacter sp. GCM10028922 TaxID=3273428 RepID=UPI0036149EF0